MASMEIYMYEVKTSVIPDDHTRIFHPINIRLKYKSRVIGCRHLKCRHLNALFVSYHTTKALLSTEKRSFEIN